MLSQRFSPIALLAVTFVAGVSARPTIEQIESWVIANPSPQYPTEALARHEQGSGVIKLHFRVKTGRVRTASVSQSTGFKELDAAAVKAFTQWRFKPGVLPTIRSLNSSTVEPFADEDFVAKIPITFALSSGGAVNVGGFGASRKPIILKQPPRGSL
jgi:TonB family protein